MSAQLGEQVLKLVVELALAGRLTDHGVFSEDCTRIRALCDQLIGIELANGYGEIKRLRGEQIVMANVLQEAAAVLRTVDDAEGFSCEGVEGLIDSCERLAIQVRVSNGLKPFKSTQRN